MNTSQQIVTCGNCARSWDERVYPAPSALCHWCHGTGNAFALDDNEIRVIYRQFDDGDAIALFPDDQWNTSLISSYQIVGQHSGADRSLIDDLRPADEDQQIKLSLELSRIGYRLQEQTT